MASESDTTVEIPTTSMDALNLDDRVDDGETSDSNPLQALLTADTNIVLDLIDQLRRKGIKNDIPLPQVIVVGDQSSGKSSVLEAISRLTFPRGETLCTTFATELALRRKPNFQITASIEPASGRTDEECQILTSWQPRTTDLQEFQEIVLSASERIQGLDSNTLRSYSHDTLRIQVEGPSYPQLTLVDLTGLIRQSNVNQQKNATQQVLDIVSGYMADPSSIILAIMSAEIEQARQDTLSLVEKHDPAGERTIGVLTKPADRSLPNSAMEQEYISIARNEHLPLTHGWHVPKNRDYRSGEQTTEQRDANEQQFFEDSNWGALDPSQLGAEMLRQALSRILDQKIRNTLPMIIESISTMLARYQTELASLGPARATTREQQDYLAKIARAFEKLVHQQVIGDPSVILSTKGRTKETFATLRAELRALNREFARDVFNSGPNGALMARKEVTSAIDFFTPLMYAKVPKELIDHVASFDQHSLGQSLQGVIDRNRLIEILFKELVEPWKAKAEKYLRAIMVAVRRRLSSALTLAAGKETAVKIQTEILSVMLAKKEQALMAKLDELVVPYEQCHPSTSNPLFDLLHNMFLSSAHQESASDITKSRHSDYELAIREMNLYYQFSLANFVDNVNLLAVEMVLIRDLHEIFWSDTVLGMEHDQIQVLAAESPDRQRKRRNCEDKIEELRHAMRLCQDAASGAQLFDIADIQPRTPVPSGTSARTSASTPHLTPSGNSPSPMPESAPSTPRDATMPRRDRKRSSAPAYRLPTMHDRSAPPSPLWS